MEATIVRRQFASATVVALQRYIDRGDLAGIFTMVCHRGEIERFLRSRQERPTDAVPLSTPGDEPTGWGERIYATVLTASSRRACFALVRRKSPD